MCQITDFNNLLPFTLYLVDTTGLQSSFAVLELNGSITVTCTFATGATSDGCQVTILMGDLQMFPTIITRSIGVNQVKFLANKNGSI